MRRRCSSSPPARCPIGPRAVLIHPPAADPLHRVAFVDVPRAVWARNPASLLRRLRAAAAAADGDQSDEVVDGVTTTTTRKPPPPTRAALGPAALAPCCRSWSPSPCAAPTSGIWPLAPWPGPPLSWVLTPAALADSRSVRRIARTTPDAHLVADPHAAVFAILVTEPVREATPAPPPAATTATVAPAADGED
ncbi:hypothetical protein HK405_000692, partial [Cladochytrium tenue]